MFPCTTFNIKMDSPNLALALPNRDALINTSAC